MVASASIDTTQLQESVAELTVCDYSDGDYQRWDAFVEKNCSATFFHKAGWKSVIEKAFGHRTYYIFAERNGNIEGILPLVHIKSLLFGNSLVSTPFCVYGGVIAENEDARKLLLTKARTLAEKLGVGHLEVRNTIPSEEQGWETKDLYVTFRKEISEVEEENMKSIPRKQRAMVRKGIKAGLEAEIDQDVERFYDAYSQSVHALGTPVFSKKYFKLLCEEFNESTEVLTITLEGKLVSSVLSFYFRDEVLPYYGGGTPLARSVKGNDFMYWELMKRAGQRGVKIFDYGRSKKGTGSYSFKKNWGFEPQPLAYEYYLVKAAELPDINPLNPKYQLFINVWKRMPLSLTRVIGPHVVKNLG